MLYILRFTVKPGFDLFMPIIGKRIHAPLTLAQPVFIGMCHMESRMECVTWKVEWSVSRGK